MKTIQIRDAKLKVKLATTPEQHQAGLKNVFKLASNQGMLFCYPRKDYGILSFWMRDTIIPLSIAFIDKDGRITQISDMNPRDESGVKSNKPSLWALETNQGWFADNKIKIGDKVEGLFSRGIKIRVLKLPPKAQALAKKIEDALVAMTKQALGGK
tara:strand:+ start:647 stop:1114 length:468 start_codon:yes stop_codon:yes gene_type:complete